MKITVLGRSASFVAALLLLAGCKGPEGVYAIDKAETKKTLEAEIAKAPADQQAMGKLVLSLFDQMDMSLELKKGGEAEMKMSMPSPTGGEAKSETKKGTWSKDGSNVIVDSDGKKMTCALDASKLTCEASDKSQRLVFMKK
jgi:hypothetical protein